MNYAYFALGKKKAMSFFRLVGFLLNRAEYETAGNEKRKPAGVEIK